MDTLDTHHGLPHCVRREYLFEDVIELYKNKREQVLNEFPFQISYDKEKAIDTGGVCRDMFSAFWEDAYLRAFDGGSVLVPAVHPHVDMTIYPVLGTVLSYGFLSCGFLPIRLAFPVIAAIVHGPMVNVPDHILVKSFAAYLSSYESSVICEALQLVRTGQQTCFSAEQSSQLVYILSQLGCREIPRPSNLKRVIVEVARHELLIKPLGALHALRSGVPVTHHGLWNQLSVEELFALYNALNASPHQILSMIKQPDELHPDEARVFHYFVGNLNRDELSSFLRFVTGSSVCSAKEITISFNRLSGLARRPISHTCSCLLELSTCYYTYPDFADEFMRILSSEIAWPMEAL